MKMTKLCVFDLDGTLWKINSHVAIVQKYKYRSFYRLVQPVEKIAAHVFPCQYQNYLNTSFDKIPRTFIDNYHFYYRIDARQELEKRKSSGEKIIVISNAPPLILDVVARDLKVECLSAKIGEKDKALIKKNSKWDRLTVVTDNLSDASLLLLADEAIVYTPARRKASFDKLGLVIPVDYRPSDID